MLATSVVSVWTSTGSMSGVMVVRDTPPPSEGLRTNPPPGKPAASRFLFYRPVGTIVCYGPMRFHVSRSLSLAFQIGDQFRQLNKTAAVQEWRLSPQNNRWRRIGLISPFPRDGERTVRSSPQNQRLDSPNPPNLQQGKPFPIEGVKRVRDLDRSRKGTAIKCSSRKSCPRSRTVSSRWRRC